MKRKSAWLSAARAATVIAALAVLATACSNHRDSPSAGGSASSPSAVGFASCMRSHGVPGYPDPASNGTLPKTSAQELGVSSSQYQAATRACQHLLPNTSGSLTASSLQQCYLAYVCPATLVQRAMSAGLIFARCMRAHGVPSWPDPTIDPEGRPLYNITVPRPTPPPINAAINECTRLAHPGSLLAWG